MNPRTLFTALALVLALAVSGSAFAKNCKKGKPCGNACIAKDAACTKDGKDAAPGATDAVARPMDGKPAADAAKTADTPAKVEPMSSAKKCTKGKPCGNACIAETATCTVQ